MGLKSPVQSAVYINFDQFCVYRHMPSPNALLAQSFDFWFNPSVTYMTKTMQWHLVQFILATSTWPISFAIVHDSRIWSPAQMVTIFSSSSPAAGDSSAWTSCHGWEWLWGWTSFHPPFRFPVSGVESSKSHQFFNDLAALKRIGNRRAVAQIWPPQTGGKRQVTWGRRNIDTPAWPWTFYFDILWHIHDIPNIGLQYMMCCQTVSKFGRLDSNDHRDMFVSDTQCCLWDHRPSPD